MIFQFIQRALLYHSEILPADPNSIENLSEALEKNDLCVFVLYERAFYQHAFLKRILPELSRKKHLVLYSDELRQPSSSLKAHCSVYNKVVFIPIHFQLGRNGRFLKRSIQQSLFANRWYTWVFFSKLFRNNPIFASYLHAGSALKPEGLMQSTFRFRLKQSIRLSLRALSGTPVSPRKHILKQIERSDQIGPFSTRIEAKKRRRILLELTSNLKPRFISLGYILVSRLFKRLFEKIEVSTSHDRELRSCIQSGPVIYLPCHKSHLDYLLISYGLYMKNLHTPYIAAGINLNFFPVGFFFRRMGAYFIRRRISGDRDYTSILFKYVRMLLTKNAIQEFFIEGGRSRSGMLRESQTGLLSMQIQSFLKLNPEKKLHIVPVMVSYDQIPDEDGITNELIGKPKVKETMFSSLRLRTHLKQNYGRAYLSFLKPIAVVTDEKAIKPYVQKISDEVMSAIAHNSPVTPHSILAGILLSSQRASSEEVKNQFLTLSQLFKRSSVPFLFGPTSDAFDRVWTYFEDKGYVKQTEKELLIPSEKRVYLDYYKNYSVRHLVPLWLEILKTNSIKLEALVAHHCPYAMMKAKKIELSAQEQNLCVQYMAHSLAPYRNPEELSSALGGENKNAEWKTTELRKKVISFYRNCENKKAIETEIEKIFALERSINGGQSGPTERSNLAGSSL